jgi:hypothetical protein
MSWPRSSASESTSKTPSSALKNHVRAPVCDMRLAKRYSPTCHTRARAHAHAQAHARRVSPYCLSAGTFWREVSITTWDRGILDWTTLASLVGLAAIQCLSWLVEYDLFVPRELNQKFISGSYRTGASVCIQDSVVGALVEAAVAMCLHLASY